MVFCQERPGESDSQELWCTYCSIWDRLDSYGCLRFLIIFFIQFIVKANVSRPAAFLARLSESFERNSQAFLISSIPHWRPWLFAFSRGLSNVICQTFAAFGSPSRSEISLCVLLVGALAPHGFGQLVLAIRLKSFFLGRHWISTNGFCNSGFDIQPVC